MLWICSAFSLKNPSKGSCFNISKRLSDISFTYTFAPSAFAKDARPPIPADGSRTVSDLSMLATHEARYAMFGGVENCCREICSSERFVCVGIMERMSLVISSMDSTAFLASGALKSDCALDTVSMIYRFTPSSIASVMAFTSYLPSAMVPPYALSAMLCSSCVVILLLFSSLSRT